MALPCTVRGQEYRKSGSLLSPPPFPKGLGPHLPAAPNSGFCLLGVTRGREGAGPPAQPHPRSHLPTGTLRMGGVVWATLAAGLSDGRSAGGSLRLSLLLSWFYHLL